MMALFPNDKIDAIKAFASKAFPGFDVDVSRGGTSPGPRVRISGHDKEYTLFVDREFMDEFGPVNLQSNLDCHGAAETMKSNPGKTCTIDLSGISCA